MNLLALDLSKRMTGWARFLDGNLVDAGRTSFVTEDPYFGATLAAFRAWVRPYLSHVDLVAYEEVVPRNKYHMEQHFGMVGILAEVLYAQQVPLLGVHTPTLKKRAAGHGRASKEATLAAVRALYPEHDIADHNVADAIAVGLVATERVQYSEDEPAPPARTHRSPSAEP